jgi:hypothetical protein
MRRALAATLARGLGQACGSTTTTSTATGTWRRAASSSSAAPAAALANAATHYTPTPAASALDDLLNDALREAAAAGTFKREREIQGPQGPVIS